MVTPSHTPSFGKPTAASAAGLGGVSRSDDCSGGADDNHQHSEVEQICVAWKRFVCYI